MNNLTLNCFIKDKTIKPVKLPTTKSELKKKLDHICDLKIYGDHFNNLVRAHNSVYSLITNTGNADYTIAWLLNYSNDIIYNKKCALRVYNDKLYSPFTVYCKETIVSELSKRFDETFINEVKRYFDSLYAYIENLKYLEDSNLYLWIIREIDSDTYNKLHWFNYRYQINQVTVPDMSPEQAMYQECSIEYPKAVSHPTQIGDQHFIVEQIVSFSTNMTKFFYLLTNSPHAKYGLINGDAVIYYNDDAYELKTDTLTRLLYIDCKSPDILNKFTRCLEKEIKDLCIDYPIKGSENNRPLFRYLLPGEITRILISKQGTLLWDYNYPTAFFKPIIIALDDYVKIQSGCSLQTLCKSLQVISNNNYTIVKEFAKLFADCLLPYPQSRKLYVINAKDECDIDIIKHFIKRVLSYNNGFYNNDSTCIIDKDLTINDVCKSYELFDELKYTRIYALFMNNRSAKLTTARKIQLFHLVTRTSNKSNGSTINNIQPILFQTAGEMPDFFAPGYIEYIDLSNSQLDERINTLSSEGCCWTRLYFSLYGLHLIFENQKSKLDFDLGCKLEIPKTKTNSSKESIYYAHREEYISKITSELLDRYFVTAEEAATRKSERSKRINELKEQYKGSPDLFNILTEELSHYPLFGSPKKDLNIYIETFLATQCKSTLVKQNNVQVKDIYQEIESTQRFKTGEVNAQYAGQEYGKKLGRGFQNLSLKEIWPITKSKMEATNVNNNVAELDTEPIEAPKTATFDDPIDENLLDFLTKLNNAAMF